MPLQRVSIIADSVEFDEAAACFRFQRLGKIDTQYLACDIEGDRVRNSL